MMDYVALERGKQLIKRYYKPEAVAEMLREFHRNFPMLDDKEFPVYVAYCYDMENAPVDAHCW